MVSKNKPSKAKPPSPHDFEASIQRLAEIVEQLEGGELPLEQSLSLFEEGIKLARASQRTLDQAEKRVEQLLAYDERGEPVVVRADAVDADDTDLDDEDALDQATLDERE